MKPRSRDRIALDLCGQDGRRIGKPVKLTPGDMARVWCATQALALDDDAWLTLPRIWRDASALRGSDVADTFELRVHEELTK
jgi:hypothetical protein